MEATKLSSKVSQVLAKFKDGSHFDEPTSDLFAFGKGRQYEVDVAQDIDTRIEAYQLMYRLYRNEDVDYADEHSSEMWYSLFNAQTSTVTLVAKEIMTKKVVATLTIVFDTDLGLPMEENYPEQINELRSKRRKCAEIISLGFDENFRYSNDLLVQLFKVAYVISSRIFLATDFLIMIKPRHAQFYERKMFFEPIGKIVNCTKIKNKPVILYHIDLLKAKKETEEDLIHKNGLAKNKLSKFYGPFVEAQNDITFVKDLKQRINASEMSIHELEYFFVQSRNIFDKTNTEKMFKISKQYRDEKTRAFLCNYISQELEVYLPV